MDIFFLRRAYLHFNINIIYLKYVNIYTYNLRNHIKMKQLFIIIQELYFNPNQQNVIQIKNRIHILDFIKKILNLAIFIL